MTLISVKDLSNEMNIPPITIYKLVQRHKFQPVMAIKTKDVKRPIKLYEKEPLEKLLLKCVPRIRKHQRNNIRLL